MRATGDAWRAMSPVAGTLERLDTWQVWGRDDSD